MARIQELLEGRNEKIDYNDIISRFPWIVEKEQKCIISPDSDGFLCGLLMSHLLGWHIMGFYDNGKLLLIQNGITPRECVFLDTEIFRSEIRSVGHHMVLYNNNRKPNNWTNYQNCIQPNNLRGYDKLHTFRLKYPLGTIHLLLGIIGSKIDFEIPESAICPLLFTDGVYQILFRYPENVLNWLQYLRADEAGNTLNVIFGNETHSVYGLMQAMDGFFRRRDEISIKGERGDLLKLSDKNGDPYNIEGTNESCKIANGAVNRSEHFIEILLELTGWNYKRETWAWDKLKLYKFSKRSFQQNELTLNGKNYESLLQENPLSWAITDNKSIEYTIEDPDSLSEG